MLPSNLVNLARERMEPFQCEGFVYGKGPKHAPLMFIGEAPGETEVNKAMPFSGRAGKVFNGYLEQMGKSREDIYITSTIRSRPYKVTSETKEGVLIKKKVNRTPGKQELIAHAPVLDYEIEQVKPKILVPMGRTAFWRLTGQDNKMSEVAGKLLNRPIKRLEHMHSDRFGCSAASFLIYPIYHPAALLYNPVLKPVMYDLINELIEIEKGQTTFSEAGS